MITQAANGWPGKDGLATSLPHRPLKPFYFNTSDHLLRITGLKAGTLAELLAGLRSCSDDSIFQHTFRTLQEHHFIREGFANDFGHWVRVACGQTSLAEQLATVDVRDFTSLGELRQRFIQIIEGHLHHHPAEGSRPAKGAFHFCASDIVVIPTRCVARSMQDFIGGLGEVSLHSIHHHFIEARLRLKLMSNDFSQWLNDAGLPESGHQLNRIDIYVLTLEEVRQQIIQVVERATAEHSKNTQSTSKPKGN